MGWEGDCEPRPCRSASSPEMGIRGGPFPGPQIRLGPLGRPAWLRSRPAQELPLLGKDPASSCSRTRSRWWRLFTALGPGNPRARMDCWGLWEAGEEWSYGVGPSSRCGEVTTVRFLARLFCCVVLAKLHSLHSVGDFSALGRTHLSEERPQFPHLQPGKRDLSCLSPWQPQGWTQTASFRSC